MKPQAHSPSLPTLLRPFRPFRLLPLLALLASPTFAVAESPTPRPLSIVASTFPQYDWLRNLIGKRKDTLHLSLLQARGSDLHNYTPSAADIVRLSSCDLFVYVGGASDQWVANTLRSASNPSLRSINLLASLNLSQPPCEEDHDHDPKHHHHPSAPDEHIWLSLRFATRLCQTLTTALVELDPAGAPIYRRNCELYTASLQALDHEFSDSLSKTRLKTLLFADRFPFHYLARDYHLTPIAAFPGCTAECNASFKTISSLAAQVDALHASAIFTLENTSQSIAPAVLAAAKTKSVRVLPVNSMQSVTEEQIAAGATYLSLMRETLTTLVEGLQ